MASFPEIRLLGEVEVLGAGAIDGSLRVDLAPLLPEIRPAPAGRASAWIEPCREDLFDRLALSPRARAVLQAVGEATSSW